MIKPRALRLRERLRLKPLYPGVRPLAVAALLGVVSVFGFAPFYLFPLPIIALAALAWLWQRCTSAGQALVLGFVFGLGFFLTGTSWVYVSMHDFGGMAMPVAAFATLVFCSVYALLPAAAGWLFKFPRLAESIRLVALLPCAWAATEWTRGWTFTGFPWLALGYSQSPYSPLSGFAPLFGVYGVSLVAAASAGLICHCVSALTAARRFNIVATASIATLCGIWLGGFCLQQINWTEPLGAPVSVSLVQGNIKQDMKWRPEWIESSLRRYLDLTLSTRGRLILLPETALPMFKSEIPPDYLDGLAAHARRNGGDLLVGIPEYVDEDGHRRYFNSVISLGSAPLQTYRKYHLVPFGDYFPQWGVLNWIMSALDIPMSDFARGDPVQQPMAAAGQHIAVDICYEDAFGEEIIRQLPKATLLANFTNDAWWGESWASDQHVQIAQMRAQESGRYMLRATNTGVTGIIDQRGRIRQAAAQHTATTLEGEAQGFSGATPYVRWGNWPLIVLAVGGVVVGLFSAPLRAAITRAETQ